MKAQWENHYYTSHLMQNTARIRDSKEKGEILSGKKQQP